MKCFWWRGLLSSLLLACSAEPMRTTRDGATMETGTTTPDAEISGEDASVMDAVDPPDESPSPDVVNSEPASNEPTALVEVQLLDVWAQPLPSGVSRFAIRQDGNIVSFESSSTGSHVLVSPLSRAGSFTIDVEGTDYRSLSATLRYDGTTGQNAVTGALSMASTGAGLTIAHGTRMMGSRRVPLHTVYLGLRHRWFSAQGRPARRGNNLRLLMDGEEAWSAVHQELTRATSSIHMATWWWESNFELVRDPATHVTSTEAQRRANTVLSVLENSPARKRVLVGQFLSMDGTVSTVSADDALRAHATNSTDRFEHMGQANPTRGMFNFEIRPFSFGDRVRRSVAGARDWPAFERENDIRGELAARTVDLTHWPATVTVEHASYHQKFAIVDDRVAFIGGMNLRRVDWDTSQHFVFEPRRMLFGATTAQRQEVLAHTRASDTGPRKDYMVRIEGPIVYDTQDVFRMRWQFLRETHARYWEDASDITPAAVPAPIAGGVMAQVTATLPEPFHEQAILESWINAIREARRYVYIEDQYFRIPVVVDELVRRMQEVPELRVVVLTKPISEWTDPGCAWTRRTHEQLQSRFPTRYQLLQLRSFDTEVTWGIDETEARFLDMDLHAKLLIVDDVFLSVGSCNKNNRGVVYEGELNIAVYDAAWVRAARRRVLAAILPTGATISDDPAVWFNALDAAARNNDQVRARWTTEGDDISLDGRPLPAQYRPSGFLYTLPMRGVSQCLIEDIGPDMV